MASEETQKRTNGILPMPATQASTGVPASTKSKTKTPIEGDKVVIRRLPPGLTEEEFWGFIGEKWKVGQGLVDWFDYQQGKVVQDPAKVSKPGRAYLHVLKRDYLTDLSAAVEECTWEDAKGTFRSPSLVGPPVVEFCIYKRIPGTKRRTDPRQGTIDQDPEFMAYLLSLTNPELDRDTVEDKTTEDEEAHDKVTTTPLVEYLKEKKANKAKDAAAAKSAKHARQESQGGKNRTATATTDDSKRSKKDKDAKSSKSAEKPKENIKILTKKAATAEAVKAAETAATQVAAAQDAPKSRRANIAAAARILQRDLGLSPGSAHRKARLSAAKSEAESKSTTKASASEETSEPPAPAPAASTATASSTATTKTSVAQPAASAAEASTPAPNKSGRSRRGGGGKNVAEAKSKTETKESAAPQPAPAKPIVLLKKKDKESPSSTPAATPTAAPKEKETPASTKNTGTGSASKSSGGRAGNSKKGSSAAVTPGATRGFVKHANSSQGVTEPLLRQALQTFGTVTSVEMDRRKGFAYVDFADHESLAKAIAAGPVSVGQGNVQVMERKDKKPAAAGTGNSSKDSKDAKQPAASSPAAPPSEKAEQPAKEQSSGPRRNRRGRGGGGGKGGGGGGEGKGAAATSKANAGGAGTA